MIMRNMTFLFLIICFALTISTKNYAQNWEVSEVKSNKIKPNKETVGEELEKKFSRFHITIGLLFSGVAANEDISKALARSGLGGGARGYFGRWTQYPYDRSEFATLKNVCFEYNILRQVRLGWTLDCFPLQNVIGKASSYETADGYSNTIIFNYVLKPFEPRLSSGWEWVVGAGISYHSLTVSSKIGWVGIVDKLEVNEHAIGGSFKSSLDYYFKKGFSAQISLQRRVVPKIDVPELVHDDIILQAHSVNFSSVDFLIGLRVHL
jgi:hypothetical protein